jgi:hypothetical protein
MHAIFLDTWCVQAEEPTPEESAPAAGEDAQSMETTTEPATEEKRFVLKPCDIGTFPFPFPVR